MCEEFSEYEYDQDQEDYTIDEFFNDAPDLRFSLVIFYKDNKLGFKLSKKIPNFTESPIYFHRPIINDYKRYHEEYLPKIHKNPIEIWEFYMNPMMQLEFCVDQMEKTIDAGCENGRLSQLQIGWDTEIIEEIEWKWHKVLKKLPNNTKNSSFYHLPKSFYKITNLEAHKAFLILLLIEERLNEFQEKTYTNDLLKEIGIVIMKKVKKQISNMKKWYKKHPEKQKCPYSEQCEKMEKALIEKDDKDEL